jgi:hypothetical protein
MFAAVRKGRGPDALSRRSPIVGAAGHQVPACTKTRAGARAPTNRRMLETTGRNSIAHTGSGHQTRRCYGWDAQSRPDRKARHCSPLYVTGQ